MCFSTENLCFCTWKHKFCNCLNRILQLFYKKIQVIHHFLKAYVRMGCDDLILEIHAISARPSHRLPCPDNYLPYYSKWNHFFANDGILIEHQQTLQFEIFAKFVLLFKKCHNSFGNYEIIVNFVPSTPNTQGRKAAVKGGMHIYGKAFTKRLVIG